MTIAERKHRGSIYQRGDGSWQVSVSGGFDPETGRYIRVRETIRGSKSDAIRRRDLLRVQVTQGVVVGGSHENVTDYLERWITHRELIGKVRPKTASVYRGYVRRTVAPRIGSMKLSAVRPIHVQRVLDEAIGDGLSARSVLQVHRILHAAFRQAVRWHSMAVNPSDGVTPPKVEQPKLATPTAEQIGRLLAAADPQHRQSLAVLAGTGLRRGELAALRWETVELDGPHPLLRVEGSLQRTPQGLQVFPPKTERSRRVVPLPVSIVGVLRRIRTEQNERRLLAGGAWHDDGYLFDRGDGRAMDPDAFGKAFRRARDRAGLQGVRLHDLRHAFATLQMANGTNARVVSDLLGHATVGFTLQVYSHPDEQMAAAAMSVVDSVIGDALSGD